LTVQVKINRKLSKKLYGNRSRRQPSVDVGVIGDKAQRRKPDSPEITVADVAAWAELGLGQPQRSWLRGYIDTNGREIQKVIKRELNKVQKDKQSLRRAMDRIGVWLVGEIQDRIANGIAPANAPSTIEKKGSSTPLIDTGQFRSSITSRSNNV
jgi:hypothetical protein